MENELNDTDALSHYGHLTVASLLIDQLQPFRETHPDLFNNAITNLSYTLHSYSKAETIPDSIRQFINLPIRSVK